MGPLAHYLADDHRRLEALLERTIDHSGRVNRDRFELFRAGLLRHIGIEEKILFHAARQAQGGAPLSRARQLHLDHGAIAAMLVPTPTPEGVARLRALLTVHDEMEEGPHGVYAECDELLAADAAALVERFRDFPTVRTAPHNDGPEVERHIAQCLARAGR